MVNGAPLALTVTIESWPIAGSFAISRGAKTQAVVIVATISDGVHAGRGECVPYARYDETPERVAAAIQALRAPLARGLDRGALQQRMPAGAARNAIDCALWDLEARRARQPVHALAGLAAPRPLVTAYTISLDDAEAMAQAARAAAHRPLLKIKLGSPGDAQRIAAVRAAVPDAELIVDANEGWNPDTVAGNLDACARAGVSLVEQPLAAGNDDMLASMTRIVPVCADESVHARASLAALVGKYDAVNIKLDKTGGLTEGLAMIADARRLGFSVMCGCMVATSLAMAPAFLLAQQADVVDLDGPLLLARDRDGGFRYEGSRMYPTDRALWG